jgi:hypothetical protein
MIDGLDVMRKVEGQKAEVITSGRVKQAIDLYPIVWLMEWREGALHFIKRHGLPLGMALAIGAVLRFIWLGDTTFYTDQAELFWQAQEAMARHAIILTGEWDSIGALNPPVTSWLIAPFSLLGPGAPIGAAIFTASINVAAIGLLYAIATRYSGRRGGFTAALLYATASGAVHYARFTWEQNLLSPFLLLLVGAVFVGLVERRAGWPGWAVFFWAICVQLHPTAALLLVVIAFAAIVAWRTLRWRDIAWVGAALVVVFAPALLWEVVSRGADLARYQLLATLKPVNDIAGPLQYAAMISPALADSFGVNSDYATVGASLAWLGPVMDMLALVSGIWLAAIAIAPLAQGTRTPGGARSIIATARWRIASALLLWQVVPMLTLIRHTVAIWQHYVLVLTPIIYLCIGLWAAAVSRAIGGWFALRWTPAERFMRSGLALVIVALAAAQTVGVLAELNAIHTGLNATPAAVLNAQNTLDIGRLSDLFPLSTEQSTLDSAQRRATELGATLAIAATEPQADAYVYLAQANAIQATTYVSDSCLILPARTSDRPLVTLALPGTQAMNALPAIIGARKLETLPSRATAPSALYLTQPDAAPTDAVELSTPSAPGSAHVIAYSHIAVASGQAALALRWSGAPHLTQSLDQRPLYWFGSTANGPLVANYTVTAQLLGGSDQPVGAPVTAQCGMLPWQDNMDMLSWLPLPAAMSAHAASWRVSLSAALVQTFRPRIGPVNLETGDVTFASPRMIAGPFTIQTR